MNEQKKFDPLLEYAKFVLNASFLALRPPKDAISLNTKGLDQACGKIHSVVIDRSGNFQTELFFVPRDVKTVSGHVHPGVDSIELGVAGEFIFECGGNKAKLASDGHPIADNMILNVPEDMVHGAEVLNGACFLSFQNWKLGSPTTIGNSFEVKE